MNEYEKKIIMKCAPGHCGYLIVLGAKVNGSEPSEILERRIEAAHSTPIWNNSIST